MKLKAGQAAGKAKELLTASGQELERLARGVQDGVVKSVRELDEAFDRAREALRDRHQRTET